jgi:hypothetical protein
MLLQAMADQFGLPVYAICRNAFAAELAPKFSYGCAVFLDTDRVNFQKEGFSKEELLAGLAQVLPKNVWQYVVQIPRWRRLDGASCCRAARNTTWRPSKRKSITSKNACRMGRSSSIRIRVKRARLVRRSKRYAWSSVVERRPSLGSMRPSI